MSKTNLNVAVVGAGYWGKNLVRNFAIAKRCNLKYVCDLDEKRLAVQKKNFPFIETSTDLEMVLGDEGIDAVVVATEVPTHFEIARKSLEAGKHVYVEKPLTLKGSESKTLVDLAQDKRLKLMVGHLLEYHPAVNYLKDVIDKGVLGQPYYMYTQRSPGQIKWVDWYAVATQAGARIERMKTERLGARCANNFPDIDSHPVKQLLELIDQRDIYAPIDILKNLARLSHFTRRYRNNRLDSYLVYLDCFS